MKRGILFNFLFLFFVTIIFIVLRLVFPFFENYFNNSFIDVTIMKTQGEFGFGRIRFSYFTLLFLNLLVSIFTNLILFKSIFKVKKYKTLTFALLNLTLFVWINSNVAEFIFFTDGGFSIYKAIIVLLLFFLYWEIYLKYIFQKNNYLSH